MMLLLTLLLTACGGGGGTTSGSQQTAQTRETPYSGSIALWDYLVPAADTTSSYIKTTGDEVQKYQTRYLRQNNSVTEVSDLSKNEKTVYSNEGNKIVVTFYTDGVQNGTVEMKGKVDIGNIVTVKTSDCRLAQHLESFKYNGQLFEDVIEIKCGENPGYYQKGVGEIMQKHPLGTTGTVTTKVLAK